MLKSPAQWGSTAYLVQILTTTKILSYDFRADFFFFFFNFNVYLEATQGRYPKCEATITGMLQCKL